MEMIWIDMGFHEKSPIKISAHHSWGKHPTIVTIAGDFPANHGRFPHFWEMSRRMCRVSRRVPSSTSRTWENRPWSALTVGGTLRMLCYLDKDTDFGYVWIMSLHMLYDVL